MHKNWGIGSGVVAVLLLCSSLAAAPGGLTKDIIIRGHVEGTVQATLAGVLNVQAVDIGVTSHAGRHYNTFTGTILSDGTGSSQGIWLAANGDRLIWKGVVNGPSLTVTIQSGTGKYKGATGGFVGTISNMEVVVDRATGKGTISYDYRGEGAVTLTAASDRISDLAQPLKIKGNITLTPRADTATTGIYDQVDVGQGTHLGNYYNSGWIQMMLVDGQPVVVDGAGQAVAANGDVSNWHMQPLTGRVILDGATEGRFEDAVGYFDSTTTSLTFEANGVVRGTYFGVGEITFAR